MRRRSSRSWTTTPTTLIRRSHRDHRAARRLAIRNSASTGASSDGSMSATSYRCRPRYKASLVRPTRSHSLAAAARRLIKTRLLPSLASQSRSVGQPEISASWAISYAGWPSTLPATTRRTAHQLVEHRPPQWGHHRRVRVGSVSPWSRAASPGARAAGAPVVCSVGDSPSRTPSA